MKGLLQGAEFTWPCSWSWKNDFKVNPVALCRFILVYIPGGPEARMKIEFQEATSIGVGILLLLMEAFLASLFLSTKAGLRQVLSIAI